MKKIILLFLIVFLNDSLTALADDGYSLWLRYNRIQDVHLLTEYRSFISGITTYGKSETMNIAAEELKLSLEGLLDQNFSIHEAPQKGSVLIGSLKNLPSPLRKDLSKKLENSGKEGFYITISKIDNQQVTVITGNEDIGVLYGVFHYLRQLQTAGDITRIEVESAPAIEIRVLNHWDNLDRTVERGYAGFSIWDWHRLPGYIDPRYKDYARANASLGINGTVLTNVNSNALVMTTLYLQKVKALADIFRPYGIKVYLTARFSAPMEIGDLKTADPTNQEVQDWWNAKVKEIYTYVPDFGGFLVKADSEGQPGPHSYNKTHSQGANMLADAVKPHNGVVMWRAFVYTNETPVDRAKQAYNEFKPLDGQFRDNVLIQVKNGAIDFQPREPFHPLFGAMPETPLMMEFQITQEYLGQATHLVYLAPLYEEVLESDTYAKGKGSTVASVIDGSLHDYSVTGIAGVSNIGNDRNWTGHLFGQSNWYAYGRLAWNPQLSSEKIADEWVMMTFDNDPAVTDIIKEIMMESREIVVNYMTPLGLHHLMGWNHHYGPAPWIKDKHRQDWTSVYYHRADSLGLGFDRTADGSNTLEQYSPEVKGKYGNPEGIPEKYLLWFHHVDWDYQMNSGRTLWEELCYKYIAGADSVGWMIKRWQLLENEIDKERYQHVLMLLKVQQKEAKWWRDASLLYFQTFSGMPFPEFVEKPEKSLEYYQSLEFPYSPGIKPDW